MTQQTRNLHAWYEEVVSGHYGLLHSIAFQFIGDGAEAEDAVQDAVLKGWRRLDSLQDRDVVVQWLISILRRTLIDRLRRRKRRGDTVSLDEGSAAAEAEGEASAGERSSLRTLLLEELAALPPSLSAVLMLRHWQHLDIAATAAVLGIDANAVRVRLCRAYARLRERPALVELIGQATV